MVRRSSHTSLLRDFSHSTLCTSSPARVHTKLITRLPSPAATRLPCLPSSPYLCACLLRSTGMGNVTQRGQNVHLKRVTSRQSYSKTTSWERSCGGQSSFSGRHARGGPGRA